VGQRQDTTLAAARTNNTPDSLFPASVPSQELKLLYRVIYQRTGANVIYQEAADYRAVSAAAASSTPPTAHSTLSGLNADDHLQYVLVDGTRNQVGYDAMYLATTNFAMAAQTTTNFGIVTPFNTPDIDRGRIYISNTNVIPFSKTVTLTLREQDARASGTAIWQADMLLSAVYNTNAIVAGATNILVSDGTDFGANSLVFISGSTNEFVRLLTVSGNNLIFKYACTNAHPISNVVSRVREFGGFSTFDSSSNKTVWGSLDFTSATTGNIQMNLDYSK
jgi:hypothetical protein